MVVWLSNMHLGQRLFVRAVPVCFGASSPCRRFSHLRIRQNSETLKEFKLDRKTPGAVTMYVCGPTVYDVAHLGHARTYIHFDVIRKILRDVLKYEVGYFMNITDVDDKIFARCKELGTGFRAHTVKYEQEFLKDMKTLGVEIPTFAPRATYYIDEIILYIEKLVEAGFAYQGKRTGSVYFDIGAFNKRTTNEDHLYGALSPSRRHIQEQEEQSSSYSSEKKAAKDFALWKCFSDETDGDVWPSPWGTGRPGWHSECSAMIHSTAGDIRKDGRLDIHGGGIDLCFPHHENERAQSQALLNQGGCSSTTLTKPWTSYYLHTGHLHIKGRKMSKSLKNFVSIKQVLEESMTPRQLRLMFLGIRYSSPMEFSENIIEQTIQSEEKIVDFFATVTACTESRSSKWTSADSEFISMLATVRDDIDVSFCNDFDTPGVLSLVNKIMRETHRYLEAAPCPKKGLIQNAADQVVKTLRVLGIEGFGHESASTAVVSSTETSLPASEIVLDVLVDFRAQVRDAAKAKDISRLFQLCDELRNETLAPLGVQVNDRSDKSTWVAKKKPQK